MNITQIHSSDLHIDTFFFGFYYNCNNLVINKILFYLLVSVISINVNTQKVNLNGY